MTKSARRENRGPAIKRQDEQPNWECRKTERPASLSEPATRIPPHKRQQPCKHCAASARKRKRVYRSWLHDDSRCIGQGQFGKNRLEARFVTQRIETAIPEPGCESAVGLDRIDFQFIQGTAALSRLKAARGARMNNTDDRR